MKKVVFLLFIVGLVGCNTGSMGAPGSSCQKPRGTYTITCTSETCGGSTCDGDQQITFNGMGESFKIWTTDSNLWSNDGCDQDIQAHDPSTGATERKTITCDEDGSTCDSTDVTIVNGDTCTIVTHWTLNKN
jgi:hypothetical protein